MRLIVFLISGLFLTTGFAGIQVNDDLGRTILLTQPAERIAALSPHLAELVFEAGAGNQLVATVEHADYPQQVNDVPKVGSHNAIDVERLVSYEPDIVLVWYSGTDKKLLDQLNRLGLTLYYSEPEQLSDISKAIRDIGQLAGTSEAARAVALAFDRELQLLRHQFSYRSKLDVFFQVWQQPLITLNGKQLVSRVIELCGGNNIFASENVIAPVISVESLFVSDPEVIIGTVIQDQQSNWMNSWRERTEMRAVKKNNLYFIEPDLLNRQTSRILLGAKQMCDYLDSARRKRVSL